MTWIKITHIGGTDYLNLDQVNRFKETGVADLIVYYLDPAMTVTYSLASADDRASLISKLSSVLKVIDIDQLATQG